MRMADETSPNKGWKGPYRGDFLSLAPLRPLLSRMAINVEPAETYTVTRRPTGVAQQGLAHGRFTNFSGIIRTGRAASAPRPQPPVTGQGGIPIPENPWAGGDDAPESELPTTSAPALPQRTPTPRPASRGVRPQVPRGAAPRRPATPADRRTAPRPTVTTPSTPPDLATPAAVTITPDGQVLTNRLRMRGPKPPTQTENAPEPQAPRAAVPDPTPPTPTPSPTPPPQRRGLSTRHRGQPPAIADSGPASPRSSTPTGVPEASSRTPSTRSRSVSDTQATNTLPASDSSTPQGVAQASPSLTPAIAPRPSALKLASTPTGGQPPEIPVVTPVRSAASPTSSQVRPASGAAVVTPEQPANRQTPTSTTSTSTTDSPRSQPIAQATPSASAAPVVQRRATGTPAPPELPVVTATPAQPLAVPTVAAQVTPVESTRAESAPVDTARESATSVSAESAPVPVAGTPPATQRRPQSGPAGTGDLPTITPQVTPVASTRTESAPVDTARESATSVSAESAPVPVAGTPPATQRRPQSGPAGTGDLPTITPQVTPVASTRTESAPVDTARESATSVSAESAPVPVAGTPPATQRRPQSGPAGTGDLPTITPAKSTTRGTTGSRIPIVTPTPGVLAAQSTPGRSAIAAGAQATDLPRVTGAPAVPVTQRRATGSVATPDTHAVTEGVTEESVRVPRDVQEAVAAVTGQRPQEVTVRRGPEVNRTAAQIAADSYATEGVVHLPGTAPLTTDQSRRLLAHELTHVVQQRFGTAPTHEASSAGRDAEHQAMRAESSLSSGSTLGLSSRSALPAPRVADTNHSGDAPAGRPAVQRSSLPVSPGRAALLPRVSANAALPGPRTARANASSAPVSSATEEASAPVAPVRPIVPPTIATQPAPPSAPASPAQPVQRRASQQGPPPVPRPPLQNNADAGFAGRQGGSKAEAPTSSANAPSAPTDTATDDVWLQRHAQALYPHIRFMLRNEFLLDRERRGRLMRDD